MEDKLIQEAYYGKLPEFIKIEELLASVIQKAKKEGPLKCNPNKYPEMQKICKMFCKIFGFKKSIIYWEVPRVPDAYTYSMTAMLIYTDKKKFIQKTDRGFYDNSGTTILTVYISVGCLETGLTEQELLACILHEIGHNFDLSNYHKFDMILQSILNPLLFHETHEIKKHPEDTRKEAENYKKKVYKDVKSENEEIYNNQRRRNRKFKNYEKDMEKYIKQNNISNFRSIPIHAITNIAKFIFMPFVNAYTLAGKKGELFADSFATAYGYGKDLISALGKLSDTRRYYDPKSKVSIFLNDLATLQGEIVSSLSDVHGTDMERCQECIEKLKWDLKHNDFPPELKQELVNEINSMTACYKEFTRRTPEEKLKITKAFRKLVAVVFNGKLNLAKFLKRNKV